MKPNTHNKHNSSVDMPVLKSSLNNHDTKLYALSRWAALFESVNMIADKAEEKQIPFENIELKPLKILEYVDATSDIIMRKLLEDYKKLQNNLKISR